MNEAIKALNPSVLYCFESENLLFHPLIWALISWVSPFFDL